MTALAHHTDYRLGLEAIKRRIQSAQVRAVLAGWGLSVLPYPLVQPLLERYVVRLAGELRGRGYARDLLVMNGNGGMVAADKVSREAVKTVMSGPASGVMAAVATGRRARPWRRVGRRFG